MYKLHDIISNDDLEAFKLIKIFPTTATLLYEIVSNGNIKILSHVLDTFDLGYHSNDDRYIDAALLRNRTDIVDILRLKGFEWSPSSYNYALSIELWKYLCEHKCPMDESIGLLAIKRRDILNLSVEHGLVLTGKTLQQAIFMDNEEIVVYLLERNCPLYDGIHIYAQFSLDTMKLMHHRGVPATTESMDSAIIGRNIEKVKYLHSIGCPWNAWCFALATNSRTIEIVQYLYDNGCPYDVEDIYTTNKKIATFLHKKNLFCHGISCKYCYPEKKEEMMNLWQMDDEIYSNVIQWLPLETLKDVISLLRYNKRSRHVDLGHMSFICLPSSTEGESCGIVNTLAINSYN